jgi:hypothetical protein
VRKFKGDMNDSLDSDTDCSIFSEVDNPDRFTDGSSVTNDNTARAGVIIWRHIAFHIIR